MSAELIAVPPGHVGAVVTYLEMNQRPEAGVPSSPLSLDHRPDIDLDAYRELFRRVGQKWLWFSRLAMDDPTLERALGEVHVVTNEAGEDLGLVELELKAGGICAIRFLGLVPELAGRGHGAWLMAATLERAWRPGISRVTVHTCSLDHPAALPAYLKAGFRALERKFESFFDPRLAGLLPRDCAPQIPLVG